MERVVSSLAIRIGLINVSTLPRPNFIIVDEGFGALDSDNIANMQGAFQYLRTQFDFTMIINHLNTIKDYMDKLIPMEVDKGMSNLFSCVCSFRSAPHTDLRLSTKSELSSPS